MLSFPAQTRVKQSHLDIQKTDEQRHHLDMHTKEEIPDSCSMSLSFNFPIYKKGLCKLTHYEDDHIRLHSQRHNCMC